MCYWEIESLFILQSLGTRLSMYNTCTSKLKDYILLQEIERLLTHQMFDGCNWR